MLLDQGSSLAAQEILLKALSWFLLMIGAMHRFQAGLYADIGKDGVIDFCFEQVYRFLAREVLFQIHLLCYV